MATKHAALLRVCGLLLVVGASERCTRAADAPEATLTLAIFGDLQGVLEPCGCTRASMGGVDRLAGRIRTLRSTEHAEVIAAGELFEPSPPPAEARDGQKAEQAQLKRAALTRILPALAPAVWAPGPESADVERYTAKLAATMACTLVPPHARNTVAKPDSGVQLRRLGGIAVGLIAAQPEARMKSDALRKRGARFIIAFRSAARGSASTADEIAGADIVVTSGSEAARVSENTGMIEVEPGRRGEAFVVLRVRPPAPSARLQLDTSPRVEAAAGTVRATVESMNEAVASDPAVRRELDQLFAAMAEHSAHGANDTPSADAAYVGARTCAACHTDAYVWWTQTPHARAFRTLTERHRAQDLDCVPCHVTGFGKTGGASLAALAGLSAVGCESCHGPGKAHTEDPQAGLLAMRAAVSSSTCTACHDRDHSDTFEFAQKRPLLHGRGHRVDNTAH